MLIQLSKPIIHKSTFKQSPSYILQYHLQSKIYISSFILSFAQPQMHHLIQHIQITIINCSTNTFITLASSSSQQQSITWDQLNLITKLIELQIKVDPQIDKASQMTTLLSIGLQGMIKGWNLTQPNYQQVTKQHHQILNLVHQLNQPYEQSQLMLLVAAQSIHNNKLQQAYDIYSMYRRTTSKHSLNPLLLWFNQISILNRIHSQQPFIYQEHIHLFIQQHQHPTQIIHRSLQYLTTVAIDYTTSLEGYLHGLALYIQYSQLIGQWLPQITLRLLNITAMQYFERDHFIDAHLFLSVFYAQVIGQQLGLSQYYCQLLLRTILEEIFVSLPLRKSMNELGQNELIVYLLRIAQNLIKKGISFQINFQIWFNILQITITNQQLTNIPSSIILHIHNFSLSQFQLLTIFTPQFDNIDILFLSSQLIRKTYLQQLLPIQLQVILHSLLPYALLSPSRSQQTLHWLQYLHPFNASHKHLVKLFLSSEKLLQLNQQSFINILQNQHCIEQVHQYLSTNVGDNHQILFNKCYEQFMLTYNTFQFLIMLSMTNNNVIQFDLFRQLMDEDIDYAYSKIYIDFINHLIGNTTSLLIEFINKAIIKITNHHQHLSHQQSNRLIILSHKLYKLLIIIYLHHQQIIFNPHLIHSAMQQYNTSYFSKYYQKIYIVLSLIQSPTSTPIPKDIHPLTLLLLISINQNYQEQIPSIIHFMDHHSQSIQLLAILLFLKFIHPKISWFSKALRQMALSKDKIKSKYVYIRFGHQIVNQVLSMDAQTIYEGTDYEDGLISIQNHIQQFIYSYFHKQLHSPKQMLIAHNYRLNTNQISNIQCQDQVIDSNKEIIIQKLQLSQNQSIIQSNNLSTITEIKQEEQNSQITQHRKIKHKKKHFQIKPNKQLTVKLITYNTNKSKLNHYYVGVKDIRKQWSKTLNSLHKNIH